MKNVIFDDMLACSVRALGHPLGLRVCEEKHMRTGRVLGEGTSYYHVMSRVVDRRFIFGDREKEVFRDLMRRQARFSGVEILTHSLMDNHFHILLRVPAPRPVNDTELYSRLCAIHKPIQAKMLVDDIRSIEREGRVETAGELRAQYTRRMYDLAAFMKELKQRFSIWYNHRNSRRGTLWEERYKSVLVEGSGHPLLTVAAYIDLNPVRAGMCKDPATYRFCGYGQAVAGDPDARRGLLQLCEELGPTLGWNNASVTYRSLLIGAEAPGEMSLNFGSKELTVAEVLRIRVRYLTDGSVLGSREFVERVFDRCRSQFSPRQNGGAVSMQGADWGDLCVIRNLRSEILVRS